MSTSRARVKRVGSNAATLSTTSGGTPVSPSLLHDLQTVDALFNDSFAPAPAELHASTQTHASRRPKRAAPQSMSLRSRSRRATATSSADASSHVDAPLYASYYYDNAMRERRSSGHDGLEIKDDQRHLNPCALSWQNVSYSVPLTPATCWRRRASAAGQSATPAAATSDRERRLLNNVSGRAGPGDLTAIIGPSGAGKTTLLDLLADRVDTARGTVSGTIEVNGRLRERRTFRAVMSYVAQDTAFFGAFTVLETLQIAAGLSLPAHVPPLTREMRVQDVIDDMGLRNCARTRVGDVFHRGISHGQRKRLSIALELLANPSILLLDEPTSGLDSSSARCVMEYIARLSREGKTVVCTIHQPSSAIYELLSHLVVLSMGELVYFGPAATALAHFFSLGHVCPLYSNPAEFVVHLVNKDFCDALAVAPLVDAWRASTEANALRLDIAHDRAVARAFDAQVLRALAPSAWTQFCVLLQRNWRNNWRHPGVFWIRVLMYILLSVMVGTMYWRADTRLAPDAVVPLLFYVQAFLVFMSVAALPALIEQRAVFQREVRNSALHLPSYAAANLLAALPGIVLISVLASAIVVSCARVHAFGSFVLNLTLSLVVAESLMHVLGAAVPHYIIGIALGAGVFGMFMLCEGFMVPAQLIPRYWRWGYYLAFHTYSFESFMYEHFSRVDTPAAWRVLETYGMANVDVQRNMLVLVAYAGVLQLAFVLILYFFRGGRQH